MPIHFHILNFLNYKEIQIHGVIKELILTNCGLVMPHKDTDLLNIDSVCDWGDEFLPYYDDIVMGTMVSQITSPTIVYSTVYLGADQRKHQKLRLTSLCAGNSPGTGEFPTQMASNAENISFWWNHHVQVKNHYLNQWWPSTEPLATQFSDLCIEYNFCQEIAFENIVCITTAILFKPQCFKEEMEILN